MNTPVVHQALMTPKWRQSQGCNLRWEKVSFSYQRISSCLLAAKNTLTSNRPSALRDPFALSGHAGERAWEASPGSRRCPCCCQKLRSAAQTRVGRGGNQTSGRRRDRAWRCVQRGLAQRVRRVDRRAIHDRKVVREHQALDSGPPCAGEQVEQSEAQNEPTRWQAQRF